MNDEAARAALIETIMEEAQIFASAWSLVGGPFDSGNAYGDAVEAKEALRKAVREGIAALASAPAATQGEAVIPDLRARLGEAHDASLDDDHRACRAVLMECIRLLDAAPTPQPTAPAGADDLAFRYAKDLARGMFDKHYSSDPDYASGRVVWGLCDSLPGVLTQIDNMLTGLVRAPSQAPAGVDPEVRNRTSAGVEAAQQGPDYRGALQDLVTEFKRVFPIYYYAEPWAHDRNAVLLNAECLLSAAAQAAQPAAAEQALQFVCQNGCGQCGVKLVDFVTHATQAQDGDPWVTVASEPQIVSTCCGSPVEVWDERKQEIVGIVEATQPSQAPAGVEAAQQGQSAASKLLERIYSADSDAEALQHIARFAATQAQPAEQAGKDSARLDWIIRQGDEFRCFVITDAAGDGEYCAWGDGIDACGRGNTGREAIDAARAAQAATSAKFHPQEGRMP